MRGLTLADPALVGAARYNPGALGATVWWKGDGDYWQDSARTTRALADGDPIGSWDDASGNSRHALQATAGSRPLLKLGANGLNGHAVVRFDGTDDRLSATIDAATVQRLFVVAKKNSSPAAATDDLFGYGTTAFAQFGCDTAVAPNYWWHSNQAAASVAIGGTPTAWNIIYLTVVSASSVVWRLNGGTSVASFDPADTLTTSTALTLGSNVAAGGNAGDYDIAEVFRTSAALTVANSDSVGYYLADKFALTWTPIA